LGEGTLLFHGVTEPKALAYFIEGMAKACCPGLVAESAHEIGALFDVTMGLLQPIVEVVVVPGQSTWPQNPPFDVNLALHFAGNTCLLGKSTTHKPPQSADRCELRLLQVSDTSSIPHLAMISVTMDAFWALGTVWWRLLMW
jgi:hypothetical protein